jgi:hypothetical protein
MFSGDFSWILGFAFADSARLSLRRLLSRPFPIVSTPPFLPPARRTPTVPRGYFPESIRHDSSHCRAHAQCAVNLDEVVREVVSRNCCGMIAGLAAEPIRQSSPSQRVAARHGRRNLDAGPGGKPRDARYWSVSFTDTCADLPRESGIKRIYYVQIARSRAPELFFGESRCAQDFPVECRWEANRTGRHDAGGKCEAPVVTRPVDRQALRWRCKNR